MTEPMNGPNLPAPGVLRGRRILVAEDEYMIAEETAEALPDAGADVLGPVPSVADALHLLAAEDRIDGALLDVNLHNEAAWPVVDALLARGALPVLTTGYDAGAIRRPTPACRAARSRRRGGTSSARSPGCWRRSPPLAVEGAQTAGRGGPRCAPSTGRSRPSRKRQRKAAAPRMDAQCRDPRLRRRS